jgi:hypothetical protein
MTLRVGERRALRVLKWVSVCAAAVVVILALAVQGQQWLLRWRCERLMADMHRIRLYESTWADAQRLMHKWGAWGHYDGMCTAEDCRYRIGLETAIQTHAEWFNWVLRHGGFVTFNLLGGRWARVVVSFTVQDGHILRETAAVEVTASFRPFTSGEEFPLTLKVDTKSRQRVRQTLDDWWVMGGGDQLADHPYYKAGRPGGCKINCEEAVVTYSTRTQPGEIERLSAFNLACLTRIGGCAKLEELLPAAREWKLYSDAEYLPRHSKVTGVVPCDVPVWAMARDAHYAFPVEVLSATVKKSPRTVTDSATGLSENLNAAQYEEASVRVLAPLKGWPLWPAGAVVTAYPFSGTMSDPDSYEAAEHLVPGKRYIVFPTGDDRKDERLTSESPMQLDRCAVWEDTPDVRREVAKGVAMNDDLRGPERW